MTRGRNQACNNKIKGVSEIQFPSKQHPRLHLHAIIFSLQVTRVKDVLRLSYIVYSIAHRVKCEGNTNGGVTGTDLRTYVLYTHLPLALHFHSKWPWTHAMCD
jgi:hypothetical protein